MPVELTLWWSGLIAATAFNVAAWIVAARRLPARREQWSAEAYATRRQLLWLAAVYVMGCGFRSVLPMVEVPRICLHDVWISRVVVTRSVATIAELCFAFQWMLLLRAAATATGSRLASRVARLIVPVIVLAEVSCWIAVLTRNYLPHALENSLWTLAATLGIAACIALWPRVGTGERRFLAAAIAGGFAYVAFMAGFDVPMYLARWQADVAAGVTPVSLREGFDGAMQRCVVEHDWLAWREDAVWLSLYFTAAVWSSIALAHVPPLRRAASPTPRSAD